MKRCIVALVCVFLLAGCGGGGNSRYVGLVVAKATSGNALAQTYTYTLTVGTRVYTVDIETYNSVSVGDTVDCPYYTTRYSEFSDCLPVK